MGEPHARRMGKTIRKQQPQQQQLRERIRRDAFGCAHNNGWRRDPPAQHQHRQLPKRIHGGADPAVPTVLMLHQRASPLIFNMFKSSDFALRSMEEKLHHFQVTNNGALPPDVRPLCLAISPPIPQFNVVSLAPSQLLRPRGATFFHSVGGWV